jgi:hypothetical protein
VTDQNSGEALIPDSTNEIEHMLRLPDAERDSQLVESASCSSTAPMEDFFSSALAGPDARPEQTPARAKFLIARIVTVLSIFVSSSRRDRRPTRGARLREHAS